jgi:hypothetical protein
MPGRYTHQPCPICRKKTDFKLLPDEMDAYGRSLMVCTRCNHKAAAPGQRKPTWGELLGRDEGP